MPASASHGPPTARACSSADRLVIRENTGWTSVSPVSWRVVVVSTCREWQSPAFAHTQQGVCPVVMFFLLVIRLVLAATFAVAGIAKLADRRGSRVSLVEFGVPVTLATPLSIALPIGELMVAAALVVDSSSRRGGLAALALVLIFIAAISYNLARGHKPECHCFGRLSSAPIGWTTLVRNSLLAALAIAAWQQDWILSSSSAARWLSEISLQDQAEVLGALVISLLTVVLAQVWIIQRQTSKIRSLETKLASPTRPPVGLPVGVPAPDFRLPDLEGEFVSLGSLRRSDKRLLLVFVDPDCKSCAALLPDLARWQREYSAQLTVMAISRGTPEANRIKIAASGLTNILLQKDKEIAFAYRAVATPSAVVIRQDGTTASTLALGPDEISALVTRTISHSSTERKHRPMARFARRWFSLGRPREFGTKSS